MATANVELALGRGVDLLLTFRLGGGPLSDNVEGEIRWSGERDGSGRPARMAGATRFTTTRRELRELISQLQEVL